MTQTRIFTQSNNLENIILKMNKTYHNFWAFRTKFYSVTSRKVIVTNNRWFHNPTFCCLNCLNFACPPHDHRHVNELLTFKPLFECYKIMSCRFIWGLIEGHTIDAHPICCTTTPYSYHWNTRIQDFSRVPVSRTNFCETPP